MSVQPYYAVIEYDRSEREYLVRYFTRQGGYIRSEWSMGDRDDALLMAGRAGVHRVFDDADALREFVDKVRARALARVAARRARQVEVSA